MKRQFSLATVFRMAEKSLLCRFFDSLGVEVDSVPWDKITRRNITDLLAFFDSLPQIKRDEAEIALRQIHALGCEKGVESLGEAADQHRPDESWAEYYLSDMSLYSKSLSAWLFHRNIFDDAVRFFDVDTRTWWRKRIDLPMVTPIFNIETRNSLEREIEAFLKEKQGRGFPCTVELVKRAGGAYYFFAYPDDYVLDALVHDDERFLVHQTIRKTFEIVFVYDSINGTSEISANLSVPVKERLEEIFLRHILNVTPEEDEPKPFDLSMLLDPNFQLVTRPEDRIRATLVAMTVGIGDGYSVCYASKKNHSIHQYALSRIDELPANAGITVKHAKFRFEFFTETGRPKTLTFEVSVPNSCTLKNQAPVRVEKAQYYLKQWRIAHDQHDNIATGVFEDDLVLLAR